MVSFPPLLHPSQAHPDPNTPAAAALNCSFIASIDPKESSIAFASYRKEKAEEVGRRARKDEDNDIREGRGEGESVALCRDIFSPAGTFGLEQHAKSQLAEV